MKDWKFAFYRTLPVLFGYVFLGIAFGVLMQQAGYSVWWCLAASVLIYAGSLQFVLVDLLSGGAGLVLTAAMTLLVNSRHLFYGLSFIDRFKRLGRARPYMIFSLTDETYSVLCALPEELSHRLAADQDRPAGPVLLGHRLGAGGPAGPGDPL